MSKQDEYKKFDDQHETGFEIDSDKALVHRFRTTDNTHMRQDISLEMNRRLKQEIEEFNQGSLKQSRIMVNLTKWIM